MRIARYRNKNRESYGIYGSDKVIDLPLLAQNLKTELPNGIDAFIGDETAEQAVELLIGRANSSDIETASAPLNDVLLLAPIESPPKIVCLGWNYFDHAAERKVEPPEEPVFFMKPRTAIVGPGDYIVKRPFVRELDYEGELAVVIGKKAKDVSVERAAECIFGYTILNDVSARDFQFKDKQWTRGKGFDTFAPIGPCIVTKRQLPETGKLSIRTWVNGELRQNGSTHDMIFSVAKIIYHLSRVMTLEPHDVISTGTPSGVAMAMKEPKWLKAGDVVRIEIEDIGSLENRIKEA